MKKAINVSYDVAAAEGELARVFCKNAETGGVSNGNWGKNDGFAVVTYPLGYEGVTDITIQGNHGGTDQGTIKITADGAEVVDSTEPPVEPPEEELPVDPDYGIEIDHPYVDIGFPEDQPHPDQGLPEDQPEVNPL